MTRSSPFIWQIGKKVGIVTQSTDTNQVRKIEIQCDSYQKAHQLALALSGLSISRDPRFDKFLKLQTHPWYGTVLLENLSGSDREYIVLFIIQSRELTSEEYRYRVQRLFIDDPNRGDSHAVIQEVLSLCK